MDGGRGRGRGRLWVRLLYILILYSHFFKLKQLLLFCDRKAVYRSTGLERILRWFSWARCSWSCHLCGLQGRNWSVMCSKWFRSVLQNIPGASPSLATRLHPNPPLHIKSSSRKGFSPKYFILYWSLLKKIIRYPGQPPTFPLRITGLDYKDHFLWKLDTENHWIRLQISFSVKTGYWESLD